MGYEIRKVAVLGAGVMGQGIAAHLANAGVPCVLFDIVPRGVPAEAAQTERDRLALAGIENAKKLKPAAFFHKSLSRLITPANMEDHGALLGQCDWIVEVVVERMDIKHSVYRWVAQHRRPGSVVSSNTSGLKLADMAEVMPEEMRQHFCITHFFNPVRYMRLLEVVAGPHTLPEVKDALVRFGLERLGKGVVFAKDTPAFIANRIGTHGIAAVFRRMGELGLGVEEVDAVFGPAMARAKSAVFRTGDLVGLDTLVHVMKNLHEECVDDEDRELFQPPAWLERMVAEGALGDKTGFGFYKKSRTADGAKVILARNLETGGYAESPKVRFASTGAARNQETPAGKLRAVLAGTDKGAQLAWAATADSLIYTANRIPEVADDLVDVDRAMRWGFGWDLGPFEGWDAVGVGATVARMEAEGRTVTPWVKAMLAAGRESFYGRDEQGRLTVWDPGAGSAKPVPMPEAWVLLDEVKVRNPAAVVAKNLSASLVDLGDDVACLEFHSKMNALDPDIVELYDDALDQLESGRWKGLVVGNQGGPAYCAGANLFMVAMAAMQKEWGQLERMIRRLQEVFQRARFASRPVVTAPRGLTLGGGCEVSMHSAHTRAAGETYIGLVEVGVGVIPAGGGCKEMLARAMGSIVEGTEYDPNPFTQQAFKNIALANVATSAEEGRAMGYLRPTDTVTMDADSLIGDAKKMALGLFHGGWRAPQPVTFKVAGHSGRGAIEAFLYQMREGGYATAHDVVVGKELARVMTGGDRPGGAVCTEQDILDLEVEAFLSLLGTQATIDRIQHMLTTGKPLRN